MDKKRTIDEVLNLKTGEKIFAEDLLNENNQEKIFQLRQKLEIHLQKNEREYVCIYCKQPVVIRGRKNAIGIHYYFKHPYKSKDCPIKIKSQYTEEQIRCIKYNGEKESELHNYLKTKIAYYLDKNKDVASVRVEKVLKHEEISRKWRKPDILALFSDKTVAIELQLSTTFLSVIVGRTIFYNEKGIFLLWIFPHFSLDTYVQKFTQKDIYYNNNSNVYVFDKDAEQKSEEENELVIKCYFKKYLIENNIVNERWEIELIKISQITFEKSTKQYWYYNSESEKRKCEKTLEDKNQEKLLEEEKIKTKQKVESAIQFIKKFYKNDKNPYSEDYNPIKYLYKIDELEKLNNTLDFENENSEHIAKLIYKRKKKNFIKFLFEESKIKIDKKAKFDGKTIFEIIFDFTEEYFFDEYILILFKSGYLIDEEEWKFLKKMEESNDKEHNRRYSVVFIYSKLKFHSDFDISSKNIKTLHAIHSLRERKVLGFRYENLKGINNYIFEQKPEFAELYIKYLNKYGLYDVFVNDDKSKTFINKIEKYNLTKPQQNICLSIIARLVFE